MTGRGELPPVAVDCGWCDAQFLSRARDQQPVHCPRCGHSVRVKRRLAELAAVPAGAGDDLADEQFSDETAGELEDDGDDGQVAVYDEYRNLVLAEWSPEHGAYVPRQPPRQLAVRGYRANMNVEPGGCHITETRPALQHCALAATRIFADLPVCGSHHYALAASLRISPT